MTAFPLFDLFAATASSAVGDSGRDALQRQLSTVAASMVALAVEQFEKIRALDEALVPPVVDERIDHSHSRVERDDHQKEHERPCIRGAEAHDALKRAGLYFLLRSALVTHERAEPLTAKT